MDREPALIDARDRFTRTAWILLDWAASAFSTTLITLVVAYVERLVFPEGGWGVAAGVVWAWTLAGAMLASAVIVPWVAAWADRRDAHKWALLAATLIGAGGLFVLAAVPLSARLAVVGAVVASCVGFDVAQVFTGSLLPRIAGERDADRLSAAGFAAGYAGGAIALAIATALVTAHERFGLDAAGGLRLAFASVAAWWILFSLPAAVAGFGSGNGAGHAANPGRELAEFAGRLVRGGGGADGVTPQLGAVLLGTMLALGAVQTAIAQFSSLALQRFDLDGPALVKIVLLVQAVALPGALAVGWISSRFGRRAAAAGCIAGWILVLVSAWFVETPAQLRGLAVLLALVLGGVQSVLRAAVAAMAPSGHAGVTFGLVQVGTKLSGFAVGVGFGVMELATGVPQAGLVALALQLAAAWWLLRRMPVQNS